MDNCLIWTWNSSFRVLEVAQVFQLVIVFSFVIIVHAARYKCRLDNPLDDYSRVWRAALDYHIISSFFSLMSLNLTCSREISRPFFLVPNISTESEQTRNLNADLPLVQSGLCLWKFPTLEDRIFRLCVKGLNSISLQEPVARLHRDLSYLPSSFAP